MQRRKLLNKPPGEQQCPMGLYPREQIQQSVDNNTRFLVTRYQVLCREITSDIDVVVPGTRSGS